MTRHHTTMKNRQRSLGRIIQDIFSSILIALAIAVILKVFFIGSSIIISSSMEPTLIPNDHVLVWKFLYNKRVPVFKKPFKVGLPLKRGDIIIFKLNGSNEDYVKRVIGLPGDTVSLADNRVFINNKLLDEPYIVSIRGIRYYSTSYEVPKNCLFVMGDTRNNSRDSREFGFVDMDKIIGKVFFNFFPFSRIRFY